MTERRALYEKLRKEVAADPEDVDARISLAAMYMEDNNPSEALPYYDEVLAIDPENAEAFLGLGLAWGHAILENIPRRTSGVGTTTRKKCLKRPSTFWKELSNSTLRLPRR